MWEIIINADDFGAMEKVNRAVDELLTQKILTSASILANGRFVDEAIAIAQQHKQASFGVHLNLSEGTPILKDNPDLSPILNANGEFEGNFRAVPLTKKLKKAIVREWIAQINLLREKGLQLSHADSHHHIHTRPNLLWVIKKVARETGIQKWRRSKNLYAKKEENRMKTFFKKRYNTLLQAYAHTHGTKNFTDAWGLQEYLNDGWPELTEVMCHPGLSTSAEETELIKHIAQHPKVILKNYWQV